MTPHAGSKKDAPQSEALRGWVLDWRGQVMCVWKKNEKSSKFGLKNRLEESRLQILVSSDSRSCLLHCTSRSCTLPRSQRREAENFVEFCPANHAFRLFFIHSGAQNGLDIFFRP
jgi:hypothetical protein